MDFIFIIGPSGVGKTTLAKGLYERYKGVYLEQNMVPEFCIPENVEDEGVYEEQLCWDNVLLQLDFFHGKGYKNIVALDFDDVRARELPKIFAGYRYIILRLVASDAEQIKSQMIHRYHNEGGLYDPDNVERANQVIMGRKLLPNEVQIDVACKSKAEVLEEAVCIINGFCPEMGYEYELDDERNYLSWVRSRGLR